MFTGLLNITQGSSFSYNFNVTGNDGNYVNLSGLSGFAPIKIKYGDSGILDQFNFRILNSGSGYCNISLLPIQTSNYPVTQGIYGINIFDKFNTGSYQLQFAQGYININPELVSTFSGLNITVNSGCNTIDGGIF